MQVNLDPKTLARNIAALVKDTGGSLQHSRLLDRVAAMLGYQEWRALKAASEATAGARQVLVDTFIRDWKVAAGEPTPPEHQTRYRLLVEQQGGSPQLLVMVAPVHATPDELDGRHALELLVEVNHGVPCVHLSNTPYADTQLAVYGHRRGLYLQPQSTQVRIAPLPDGRDPDRGRAEFARFADEVGAAWNDAWLVSDAFCAEAEAKQDTAAEVDRDVVAEWVGLHYAVNYDAESVARQAQWRARYSASRLEAAAAEVRAEVVEALVDDVRQRARRHGFAVSDAAQARELVLASASVLEESPTTAEVQAAVAQLA